MASHTNQCRIESITKFHPRFWRNSVLVRGGGSTARLGDRELTLLCGFHQYTLLQNRDNSGLLGISYSLKLGGAMPPPPQRSSWGGRPPPLPPLWTGAPPAGGPRMIFFDKVWILVVGN